MRHLKSGRKLSRTTSHRKAMLANLATSILDNGRVTTTVEKAKEVRKVVEHMITFGKKGTLHAIRLAAETIRNKEILTKLFNDIAPGYKDREGGYTRILKLKRRKGDNAELAIIELVDRGLEDSQKKKKKKTSTEKNNKKDSDETVNKDDTVTEAKKENNE